MLNSSTVATAWATLAKIRTTLMFFWFFFIMPVAKYKIYNKYNFGGMSIRLSDNYR